MENPLPRRINLQLRGQPDAGGKQLSSAGGTTQVLYILLLTPGVMLSLFSQGIYPLLDSRLAMGVMLSLFLLPVALLIVSFVRQRPSGRMPFIFSSVALVLWALLLILNGGLDHSPRHDVRATVVRKAILRGRRATSYNLTLTSWRPGRTQESMDVTLRVFNRATVGRPVTVELHQGFFGLAWYGDVSP
jgi:hypothetical protein